MSIMVMRSNRAFEYDGRPAAQKSKVCLNRARRASETRMRCTRLGNVS